MNTGLAVSHDAIVGFWDGTVDPKRPFASMPPDCDPLKSLDPTRRIDLLVAELMQRFAVTGDVPKLSGSEDFTPGTVEVSADAKQIFSTTGPELDVIKGQMKWLRNYADLRFDRISEINRQLDDIGSFFGAVTRLDASSRQHTLELLTAINRVTYLLEMRAKWYTWTPRPIDLSPNVHPIIQTPDHSSFPSGHATEAFALATVLERLESSMSAKAAMTAHPMLFRLAHRIAVNRTVAGVHYPIDSEAGAYMGCMIGEAIWSMLGVPEGGKGKKTCCEKVAEAVCGLVGAPSDDPKVPSWCGVYKVPTGSPDFLLPKEDPKWQPNAPHDVAPGPITAAYAQAVAGEW
ncbi:MAG: phosphatase PAP2 family protein [Pseudomonadota bacterium]